VKVLPSGRNEWLKFVAFPLKLLAAASVIVYPFWSSSVSPFGKGSLPGADYWIVDPEKLPFGFGGLLLGYLIIFLALATVAVIQTLSKDRRGAVWSAAFAVAALYVTYCVGFHPVYK
jgi:hypothetical protein